MVKRLLIIAALIWGLGVVPQVWGGMSDLERAGDGSKVWTDVARQWISPMNNGPCKNIYRPFVAALGMKIADATNAALANAIGIGNGVSIDATTGSEIKATMLATEKICVIANAVAKTLPANN